MLTSELKWKAKSCFEFESYSYLVCYPSFLGLNQSFSNRSLNYGRTNFFLAQLRIISYSSSSSDHNPLCRIDRYEGALKVLIYFYFHTREMHGIVIVLSHSVSFSLKTMTQNNVPSQHFIFLFFCFMFCIVFVLISFASH